MLLIICHHLCLIAGRIEMAINWACYFAVLVGITICLIIHYLTVCVIICSVDKRLCY